MSIFHRMKKAVVGKKEEAGSVSLCPEYDAVRGDFESLHDVMLRIRQHLLTYREANSRMWTSATSLSSEFANMLESSASTDEHPYSAMAATMKASHAQLPAEREKLDTMLNACLFPLKEQLAKYEELKGRMTEHDKQKDEVIYYQGKVTSLRSAREASRKPESQADKDKYERNVKKMMDQEAAFHLMDTQLTSELRYAFEHRVAVLGPIMLAFVCAEREIASRYTQAINEVKLVDVNEANTWLAKHEAAMAAKAVQVQTVTQTKTVVTDLHSSPTTPALTVNTLDHKASTVANVPSAVVPGAAAVSVGNVTTSGIVVSEPQFGDWNGSSSEVDAFASSQLQSPKSANAFDKFEPSFENAPAYSDPFYSLPAAANTTSSTFSDTATSTTAAADGVPYTIGSTTTHSASSFPSTTESTMVNGTNSSFPIESSTTSSTTTSSSSATTTTADVAPAVMMDDMTLEKTRGAEQLDAQHGSMATSVVSDVEKNEKSDVDDSTTFGVGEKTDMFAPTSSDASSAV